MKKSRESAPVGLRATTLELGGETLVVLSHPAERATSLELTEAERDVRRLLLEGASYADIARARGTTARTVRNQAHAVYQKLGVSGRRELARLA